MTTIPGAVVLCGGQSRRMGRPKAWLPFGPEVMLKRVVRLLGEVAGPIVVVAAPGQDVPGLPAHVQIARDPVSDRGPLQGLAAGLAAMPEGFDLVYATATDVPFLRSAWVTRLVELIGDRDLAIPEIGGYLHPLAALYRRRTVLPAVEKLLAEETRIDAAARQKIASQRKIIVEGSQEWDILYRKYYNDEVKKLGL